METAVILNIGGQKWPNSQNRQISMKMVSNDSLGSQAYEKQLNVLKVDL